MVREKEHAVVTEAGKRADLGWESRGWKFTQEELMNPPSLRDNISMEEEKVLRKKSQVFVFDCCKVLQTKSLVMCAAMTICQRYFSQVSFRKINRVDAAAAAIFLAAKVEEFRVHINSVLIVTHQVRHGSSRKLDPASREFKDYRERLLKAENQLVNALGFDFMIEHPYSHSTDLMQYMIKEGWVPTDRVPLLMKGACHLLNQSLRGTMCLEYAPFFRSRLAVYLSLLCNYVKVPESSATWAEALQFEDHRKLNRACCQLVETLDDDAGKTGKKLTKNRVVDALIVAGHIKSNKPRAPPLRTYDDFQRAGVRVRPPSPPSGHNKSKTKLPVSPDSELRRRVMAEIPELTDSPEEVDVFGNSSRPAPEVTQAMIKAGFSRRDDRVGSGSGGGGGGGGGSGYTSGGYASSSSNGKPKPKPPSGPAPPHAQRANGKASSAPHLGKRQRADERSPDGRAPRPRPPPPPQPRAPHTKQSSDHHHPLSSKSKSSSSSSSGKPRPPSTPKPPSSKSPGSGSGPRPPSSSKPRPPSTPYPKSSSSSSSSSSKPRPPSTPYPKPPSSGSKPRPPSTPYPKPPSSGSKPRPPSTPCPNPKPSSSSTSKPPPPSGPRPPSTHKPRPPSTPAPASAKPRPPSTPAPASAKPRPPATPAPASAKVRPPPPPTPPTSSKPRPPSTPKPPSTGKPHSSKPRPPSTPKPPPVHRTSSSTTPRPPSTPMPAYSSNSPSSAMKPPPPSTPRPPSMPKPGSNAAKTTPRPPSTPRPPTLPKPAMPADTPGSSARGSGEGEAAAGEAAAGAASSSPNASSSKGKHLPRPPSKPHPSKVNGNGSGNGNGVGNAVAGGGGGGHSPNGKRPRDVGDDGGGTGGGDGHPSPPKRSREDVDGASVARASASVGEPGGGGGRGRENGNGVGAAFNGSTATPGGMMKKHAVHVPSGFPRQEARSSHEKRPRDEGVEGGGGGGDPGSGGKKSRVNGYGMEFDAGGGDLDSVSSTGSATSPRASVLEDGEVEDGEIPMAALGAVSAV